MCRVLHGRRFWQHCNREGLARRFWWWGISSTNLIDMVWAVRAPTVYHHLAMEGDWFFVVLIWSVWSLSLTRRFANEKNKQGMFWTRDAASKNVRFWLCSLNCSGIFMPVIYSLSRTPFALGILTVVKWYVSWRMYLSFLKSLNPDTFSVWAAQQAVLTKYDCCACWHFLHKKLCKCMFLT